MFWYGVVLGWQQSTLVSAPLRVAFSSSVSSETNNFSKLLLFNYLFTTGKAIIVHNLATSRDLTCRFNKTSWEAEANWLQVCMGWPWWPLCEVDSDTSGLSIDTHICLGELAQVKVRTGAVAVFQCWVFVGTTHLLNSWEPSVWPSSWTTIQTGLMM